ncbi:hypothetical protein CASFOL_009706 [Castilleja foliolosa]|uniref:PTBP1-like RNA recognition motif 2 domain-containing protein n=1 Tax=Castilleja foliolosa TaxID=1961234 RepID=A0ABD3DQG6_9LAMI
MSNNSLSSISSSLAAIKVKLAQIQQKLCKSKPPRGEPNHFLLATIHHMLCPITEEVLQQVFSPHGFVENIVTFQNSSGFQALIQYQSIQSAISARNFLQGRDIYDGCCQLNLQFSNLDELQVNFNNEHAHDITIPTATVEYKPENRHDAHVDYATLDVSIADEPIPQTRQVKVQDMVVALNQQDQVYDAKLIEFVHLEVNDLLTSSEIFGDDMLIVSSYDLLALNDLMASPKMKRAENESVDTFYRLEGPTVIIFAERLNPNVIYFLSYTLRTRWFFKSGRMLWIRAGQLGRGPESGRRVETRSKESKWSTWHRLDYIV